MEVSQNMGNESFSAGTIVVREGAEADYFYLICKGRAEVLQGPPENRRFVRALGPGDHFGEIALLESIQRTASVRATEELEVYTLDEAAFNSAIGRSQTFLEELLRLFSQRFPT